MTWRRPSAWQPRVLDIASAIVIAVAVVLLFWRPGDAVTPRAPRIAAIPPTAPPRANVDTAATVIIAHNVFSATRRAPTQRFVPASEETGALTNEAAGGAMSMLSPAMLATGGDSAGTGGAVGNDAPPRLYGIVAQDGVRRALLLLTDSGGPPRLYAVGDGQRGYRVMSIEPDRVVLATSTGLRTLRLVVRERRDSLGKMP